MSSLAMSDEEIRMKYKNGVSVQILADLNATQPERIKRILFGAPQTDKVASGHIDPVRAFALYNEGKNDHEIAEALGVVPGAVLYWRRTNLLNSIPRKGTGQIDETKARDLYEAGKHDPEMAEVFGVSPQSIFNWRKQRGLPAKRGDGRPRTKRVVAIVNQDFEEAVKPMFDQAKADYQAKQKEDSEMLKPTEPAKDEKELFFADVTPEPNNMAALENTIERLNMAGLAARIVEPVRVMLDGADINSVISGRSEPIPCVTLEPRDSWESRRTEAVRSAIMRHIEIRAQIPAEWVLEYNERVDV